MFDADVRQLLWDETNVWISTGDRELVKLDPNGEILDRFPTPFNANLLAFDGQAIWVGSTSAATVHRIDGEDGNVLSEFSTDSVPGNVAGLVFDGEKTWVSYKNFAQTSGGVVTVDADGEVLETVLSETPVGELVVGFDYVWGPTLIAPRQFVRMSISRS